MRIAGRVLLSFLCAGVGWFVLQKIEPGYAQGEKKRYTAPAAAVLLLAGGVLQGGTGFPFWYGAVFWPTLTVAALCDYCTAEVYDITFYPAMLAGCGYLLFCGSRTEIWNLAVFAALQALIFRRMYGGADCLAFCLCAVCRAVFHGTLLDDLLQMLLTFVLLAAVQLLKRNVNRKGNLKEPVPLIPYIAAAMLLLPL